MACNLIREFIHIFSAYLPRPYSVLDVVLSTRFTDIVSYPGTHSRVDEPRQNCMWEELQEQHRLKDTELNKSPKRHRVQRRCHKTVCEFRGDISVGKRGQVEKHRPCSRPLGKFIKTERQE